MPVLCRKHVCNSRLLTMPLLLSGIKTALEHRSAWQHDIPYVEWCRKSSHSGQPIPNFHPLQSNLVKKQAFLELLGLLTALTFQIPSDTTRDAYICRKELSNKINLCSGKTNLKFCDLKSLMDNIQTALPPQFYLLGDSAYPLSSNRRVPYKDDMATKTV